MGKRRLLIVGAGGQGRVAADIAALSGKYSDIAFLDDAAPPDTSLPVIGLVSDYKKHLNDCFFVAVGQNRVRRTIFRQIESEGGDLVNLLHPQSVCHPNVKLGKGVIVMAGAVISTDAVIGDGVIVNTGSSVDHDCVIGGFVHISVGAHVAGTVKIGDETLIGAGATVINNIDICAGCTVAAGAVVVKNILEKGIYMGVPAARKTSPKN